MNKKNLALLANWLIENNDQLVEDHAFHMEFFRGDWINDTWRTNSDLSFSCGTVGCAIGHAPNSKIPELAANAEDFLGVSASGRAWANYSERVFGLVSDDDPEWDFCFDSDWANLDNTPKGAGVRILYLLSHQSEIENFTLRKVNNELVDKYTQWYEEELQNES